MFWPVQQGLPFWYNYEKRSGLVAPLPVSSAAKQLQDISSVPLEPWSRFPVSVRITILDRNLKPVTRAPADLSEIPYWRIHTCLLILIYERIYTSIVSSDSWLRWDIRWHFRLKVGLFWSFRCHASSSADSDAVQQTWTMNCSTLPEAEHEVWCKLMRKIGQQEVASGRGRHQVRN